jgi:hypothetical protein
MGSATSTLSSNTYNVLTGQNFFPNAISGPFMTALTQAFIIGAVLCFVAAICSALRGKKYLYEEENGKNHKAETIATSE